MCQLRIFWSVTHRVLALIWSTCSKVDQSRNFWWAISWNLDFNALWRETLLKGPKTFVNGSRHPSVPDSKTILVQISQSYDMYTCHICIHMTYVIYAPICTCTYMHSYDVCHICTHRHVLKVCIWFEVDRVGLKRKYIQRFFTWRRGLYLEDRSCIWRIEVVFERNKLYLDETSCIWERERGRERGVYSVLQSPTVHWVDVL